MLVVVVVGCGVVVLVSVLALVCGFVVCVCCCPHRNNVLHRRQERAGMTACGCHFHSWGGRFHRRMASYTIEHTNDHHRQWFCAIVGRVFLS